MLLFVRSRERPPLPPSPVSKATKLSSERRCSSRRHSATQHMQADGRIWRMASNVREASSLCGVFEQVDAEVMSVILSTGTVLSGVQARAGMWLMGCA